MSIKKYRVQKVFPHPLTNQKLQPGAGIDLHPRTAKYWELNGYLMGEDAGTAATPEEVEPLRITDAAVIQTAFGALADGDYTQSGVPTVAACNRILSEQQGRPVDIDAPARDAAWAAYQAAQTAQGGEA